MHRYLSPLLSACILLFFSRQAFCQENTTLQGFAQKTHTIDELRRDVLKHTPRHVSIWREPKLDPDMIVNLRARIEKTQCLPDRRVSTLPSGRYAVQYFGETKGYLYSAQGKLFKLGFTNKPVMRETEQTKDYYPIKTANYLYPSGTLTEIGYTVTAFEDYFFNPKGELLGFCIKYQCYSPSGRPIATRTVTEECR